MNIRKKDDLISFLLNNKAKLRQLGIKRFGLFGSFAKGEQQDNSDIDLLIEFEPGGKSFDNFMEVLFFLEDHTLRKIDLITPESLSPYIGPAILKEAEYYAL